MRTNRNNSTDNISATKEDYVRAIFRLQQNTSTAGVTEIADRLHLSKSTVSERIKDLVADGLAETAPYAGVSLSKKGLQVAQEMNYKHRLIEVFLHQTLGMSPDDVHNEAERLEHAFSNEAIKRLASFLGHPTADPHGTEIKKPDNWLTT
jgi:DtxR family Mn-dependent transcriptional regulator